jgi:transcription elongation factor GreA
MTEPITVNGAQKLQDELNDLINNKRQKVIQAIAEAREHGDLKENAEYHAAKEEQGHIESRIQEIQLLLSNAEIIDITKVEQKNKTVIFGATIELSDLDNETKT